MAARQLNNEPKFTKAERTILTILIHSSVNNVKYDLTLILHTLIVALMEPIVPDVT